MANESSQLSTQQLLYLNNLMYSSSPAMYNENKQASYEGRTVREFIEAISAEGNKSETCSAEEWQKMIDAISNDERLMNLEIRDTHTVNETGEAACLFVDPSTNEAIVTFKGTGGGEWKDNFEAGTTMDHGGADPTISPQQDRAIEYMEGLDLEGYDQVTVTGHSKGGNKAKTVTLFNDEVDRCVSFDGQGFSDEFVEAHADKIAENQSKVENHSVDSDFVNLLLNDFGEQHYYEGHGTENNFPKNHDPSTFFDENGNMIEVDGQSPEMKEMDRFLNSLLRSVPQEKKADILDFAGEIAQGGLGYGGSGDKIMDILTDPRYADEAGYIVAYMLKYERETGRVTGALKQAFEKMGMGELNGLFDGINTIATDDDLYGLLQTIASYGDDIPDWGVALLKQVLKRKCGLDLTTDQLKAFLKIADNASGELDNIVIHKNDGEDLWVPDKVPVVFPHQMPTGFEDVKLPEFKQVDLDDLNAAMTGSEGMYILVHFDELLSCCEEMNVALEEYNRAVGMVKTAADDLASKWEGAAKDAFVANQASAQKWYSGISTVVDAMIRMVRTLHDLYSNTEGNVTQIMSGR